VRLDQLAVNAVGVLVVVDVDLGEAKSVWRARGVETGGDNRKPTLANPGRYWLIIPIVKLTFDPHNSDSFFRLREMNIAGAAGQRVRVACSLQ
jgi:hypothetical protein